MWTVADIYRAAKAETDDRFGRLAIAHELQMDVHGGQWSAEHEALCRLQRVVTVSAADASIARNTATYASVSCRVEAPKWYGHFHDGHLGGGTGYPPDLLAFRSLADAREYFEDNAENSNASLWLYADVPSWGDAYPDRLVEMGPRGGARVNRV